MRAGTEGVTIWPEIAPRAGDIVIEKIRQSGFMYTRLDATLKELKIINLLVSGVSSGACVESTARDADSPDYFVYMLSDVTAASGHPGPGLGNGGFRYAAKSVFDQFRLPPGESSLNRGIDSRASCEKSVDIWDLWGQSKITASLASGNSLLLSNFTLTPNIPDPEYPHDLAPTGRDVRPRSTIL